MMDRFSSGEIPLDLATWLRANPFNPATRQVAASAEALIRAKVDLDKAYADLEAVRAQLQARCEAARLVMDSRGDY